jgi:hypothetical protein
MISKEEIGRFSAGRELDIVVAEHVMGWQIETDKAKVKRMSEYISADPQGRWWRTPEGGWDNNPPPYSSDLRAAWRVVERMAQQGQSLYLVQSGADNRVAFDITSAAAPVYVVGETVMMAVCKAALAASQMPTRGGVATPLP